MIKLHAIEKKQGKLVQKLQQRQSDDIKIQTQARVKSFNLFKQEQQTSLKQLKKSADERVIILTGVILAF